MRKNYVFELTEKFKILENFENMPVTFDNMKIKEFDRGVADAHDVVLPLVDILTFHHIGSAPR